MTKILVIHGAGMNMRGKAELELELFGSATLDQITEQIRGYGNSLGVELEFFHSNIEGEVSNALYAAHDGDIDAALINPAGYTSNAGPLKTAVSQVRFPVIEVHYTNSAARGVVSTILPVCKGSVTGFGLYGYYLALEAAVHLTGS